MVYYTHDIYNKDFKAYSIIHIYISEIFYGDGRVGKQFSQSLQANVQRKFSINFLKLYENLSIRCYKFGFGGFVKFRKT